MEKPNADWDRTTRTPARPCRLVVKGYVTWSSTSCGLCPGQSVKTMTWLSERSGIASIGVARRAHQPQPASAMYTATTRKRLRSDSSMSLLIMSHDTRPCPGARYVRQAMPGSRPEQTHDDRQWLQEKDGEQDVRRNRRRRDRCSGPPGIAQNKRRHADGENNAGAEDGAGDGRDERRARLTRVVAFRGCTAVVGLRLSDDAFRRGAVCASLVHRACTTPGAAGHAGFRSRRPARADGSVACQQEQAEPDGRKALHHPHHPCRMLDR